MRAEIAERYRIGRRRSAEIFGIPTADAYFDRPIALRNPIVFYEGHLPAFNVNTLVKLTHGRLGVDANYERLFARGIDPETEDGAKSPTDLWPSRECVQKYGRAADALIEQTIADTPIDEAAFTIVEHELMHHETLLYMFHEMPYARKVKRPPLTAGLALTPSPRGSTPVKIPAGEATLGQREDRFGWDNEFLQHRVPVAEFHIDRYNVTNGEYLEYVRATEAAAPHFWLQRDGAWFWRGMFDLTPLPLDWPVYTTHDEAAAYASWRGARLPTEAEFHRAAFSTPDGLERNYPWGNDPPDPSRGNFDFIRWDPVSVGSFPDGASAWGVHDLVGNGWEWTSTPFAPYEGFKPMKSYPQYSVDFFDDKHFVLKGASPATARELIRPSFRNWFRSSYPYVYATFRCVV